MNFNRCFECFFIYDLKEHWCPKCGHSNSFEIEIKEVIKKNE